VKALVRVSDCKYDKMTLKTVVAASEKAYKQSIATNAVAAFA
jgi:hypothetical protein